MMKVAIGDEEKLYRYVGVSAEGAGELIGAGYHIHEYTPYHFRITKPDYDVHIDLWPTKRKMMRVGGNGCDYGGVQYSDLYQTITKFFRKNMP